MRQIGRFVAIAICLCILSLLVSTSSALGAIGELRQLGDPAGCVSTTGTGGQCQQGKALAAPWSMAVTANGKNAYAVSSRWMEGPSGQIAAFYRDTATGALTQLPNMAGCVSETGSGGQCRDGKALVGAVALALSPDGKSLYVASEASNAVAVLGRNPYGGALTQLADTPTGDTPGCVSETGSGGRCRDGKGLAGPSSVAVSPDGTSVYVASFESDSVAVFARDSTTGALTQLPGIDGCMSETGSGGQCRDGKALDGPTWLAVSPDGNNVYVSSYASRAVAVLVRDPATGALRQYALPSGCVSQSAYTPAGDSCRDGTALRGPHGVTVSPDGNNVYVTSERSNAVVALSRNPNGGRLFQLEGSAGCVSQSGNLGRCRKGRALLAPQEVTVSPDGMTVYVSAADSHAISFFRRNTTTGALWQLDGTAGCMSEDGTGGACADGKALDTPDGVTVSPDGKNVYAASYYSSAVAAFARETPRP